MNEKEISAEELFRFFDSISGYVEKKIRLYALGGTALTILKLKISTRDIDINVATKADYQYLMEIFGKLGFRKIGSGISRWMSQEGFIFDVFYEENILGTQLLDDCLQRSDFIKSFGNIELYTLSLEDIIISKLARGDNRDFDDIKAILEKEKIDLKYLTERYRLTMEYYPGSNYKQKILDLIAIKMHEWKMKTDEKLTEEVESWKN